MRDFKINKNKNKDRQPDSGNRPPDSSLLERAGTILRKLQPTPKGMMRMEKSVKPLRRMPSIREIKENTPTPVKTIDAKPIEVNTPTRSVQNISVNEAMKTGSNMNKSVQPNMSKQEIKEEKKYLKQSEKGTWDKNVAKDWKNKKVKQAKKEFKSKYGFGKGKAIVNGETSQMRAAGVDPKDSSKIVSDLDNAINRRGY